MPSVFDLLEKLEKSPSMFIGSCPDNRGEQLRNLELFLAGYVAAVELHGLIEPVADFLGEFADFLGQRFGWDTDVGPIGAIKHNTRSDDEAWRLFWTLTKEFRAAVRVSTR